MKISLRTLLYDEPPIAISPTLCRMISLQAAVLLQQLHYWLQQKSAAPDRYKDHYINGRYWVHWTYEQLQKQIPLGKSIDPHKRLIKELSSLGVLLVEQHRASEWDRTNYYSIDYKCFDELVEKHQKEVESIRSGYASDRQIEEAVIDDEVTNLSSRGVPAGFKETEISTETSSKITTTTVVVSAENNLRNIYLLAGAERYRKLITRSVESLSQDLAQQVADEISGTIKAIEQGKRSPVFGFSSWIPSLCEKAERGELVVQYGLAVAKSRAADHRAARATKKECSDNKRSIEQLSHDAEVANYIINTISQETLTELTESVVVKFPFKKIKLAISAALLSRQLPNGLGRVEAIESLTALQSSCGGTHERHV
tara:strand:+ start:3928 stop:5037 length:1110 start_codon:yes stop_codon:yes gene_type:complete